MPLTPDIVERAAKMFAMQGKHCANSGVPTYAAILAGLEDDLHASGLICDVLAHWDGVPESVFSLRVLGALHRLALDGRAPDLARCFPTAGGVTTPEKVWPIARRTMAEHLDYVVSYTTRPPQTNEVARSAALLGGFLEVAAQYRLPLRLREIGASAGLNLLWDLYRVNAGAFSWGAADSRLELQTTWEGPAPRLDTVVTVADRAACDRDPIDIRNADDRLRLESYIWPDQVHRMARLRQACAIARTASFRLDQADAADWIETELRETPRGQTTMVFHSVFRQYLPPDTDAKLQAVMETAGARASVQSPLAWLALESANIKSFPDLTLTTWPGGKTRKLASAHYHGDWVKWKPA